MKTVLETLETLIRNGQFEDVEARLRTLGQFERKHAVAVANIARRINRPTLAIKILHSIVRPQDSIKDPPSALEKIEYAEALRRVGAVTEAWELLNGVDSAAFPQAQLNKVFCLFNQWKYAEALLLLRQYVTVKELSPYARHVGEINLAAALIHVGLLNEAESLLKALRHDTHTSEFLLLYGNSLELSAQLLILQQNYTRALEVLAEATLVLRDAGKMAGLFVQKWTAIAESLRQNRSTQELLDVFERAQVEMHWETVRDCELYIARLNQDFPRFHRLYFGTPFQSFRERILRFAGAGFILPTDFLWTGSPAQTPTQTSAHTPSKTSAPKFILDLATGRVEGKTQSFLPPGQALHRFLIIASQDFYRPVSVLSAFGKLFPGEHMTATTSANRVHQIVRRCREWIKKANLDLEIQELAGGYRLLPGAQVAVRIPSEMLPLHCQELEWIFFKSVMRAAQFDIHEACAAVAWSPSSTQRLLRWAVTQGLVEKTGKGSKTVYTLTPPKGHSN